MPLIRLQDNTPDTYCNQSRDFQLMLRLYDCIVNGVKNDADSILELTDSHLCRATFLSLLQTKLGFFTDKYINDTELRMILEAFPVIVKNKGSLKAVEQAVNVFLKIKHINTKVIIYYVTEDTNVYNTPVSAHSVIIGIQGSLQDTTILYEIFKYILPIGVDFYFYFYMEVKNEMYLEQSDAVKILCVTNNINSALRTDYFANEDFDLVEPENHLLSAIDTSEILSSDSSFAIANNILRYRGKYDATSSVVSPISGDICLAGNNDDLKEYYYTTSWHELVYRGIYDSLLNVETPTQNDIVGTKIDNKYFIRLNNANQIVNLKSVKSRTPDQWDLHCKSNGEFEYYDGTNWIDVELIGSYRAEDEIKNYEPTGLYLINGISYYYYNGSSWVNNTYAIYQLKYFEEE